MGGGLVWEDNFSQFFSIIISLVDLVPLTLNSTQDFSTLFKILYFSSNPDNLQLFFFLDIRNFEFNSIK
jgi:hypothetical protein